MILNNKVLLNLIFSAGIFLFSAGMAHAQSGTENFYIEKSFDALGRSEITATLVENSPDFYFYIEKTWWDAQSQTKRNEIVKNLDDLSLEFHNNIYPNLTNIFGSERVPGIDNDRRLTLLFHPIKGNQVSYFRTADGYDRLQIPTSNQREMLYMSTELSFDPKIKVFLAHEFTHLITFNQKEINFHVEEDVWLNEARAEYSPAILGYDDQTGLNNLQSRIRDFMESSSDSITEWRGLKYDYASASLFIHYLVDHYGTKILSDSLKSKYVGIESINYALAKNGYKEKFSDIFTNWTIALVLNDCSVGAKYCFTDKNLEGIRVLPVINFLPISGNASLSVISSTKNWSGNWQKFIGGNGDLRFNFLTYNNSNFVVPYILENKDGVRSINFMKITGGKGSMDIPNFGTLYKSLIVVPSLQEKTSDFTSADESMPFNYTVEVGSAENVDNDLIQQLLARIDSLRKQIAEIQAAAGGQTVACAALKNNLGFGMANSDVKCLQSFLKSQAGVYPEGYITGYFGDLTKAAVVRFQKIYGIAQTGFVGILTRTKINQILSGS